MISFGKFLCAFASRQSLDKYVSFFFFNNYLLLLYPWVLGAKKKVPLSAYGNFSS